MVLSEFEHEIENADWIWAKSYADTAPHWYIRDSEHPLLYGMLLHQIKEHGVDENYTNDKGNTYICRYLYYGNYKYWWMRPVINRAIIKE
tara:strand:- start:3484 stop:3753 length:270 start_codon:yes stop_codon:yes gene_type:complete